MTNQEGHHPEKNSRLAIHRAPWLVVDALPSSARGDSRGVIEDGALCVAAGLIQAAGHYRDIRRNFGGGAVLDHGNRILAPALVNSHCHLELSHMDLAGSIRGKQAFIGNPTSWIRQLLQEKDNFTTSIPDADAQKMKQARQMLQAMHREGVALVGDIGNSQESRLIGKDQDITVMFLLEILGLTKKSEALAFVRLGEIFSDATLGVACTAHAPYSTTPALIQEIKRVADRQGNVFSIHTAESGQEVEFLQTGSGSFREFLQERGAWDNTFKIPGTGSVQYLENLGVLNGSTLCVHVVHVSNREVEILAERNVKICLCPGSNRFLGVGRAPVTEFLEHGILPGLGTDSRASNEALSIWREMRLLREDQPALAPEWVFSMATIGGAVAWGAGSHMGTLEPGKRARIISVKCAGPMRSGREVMEFLTTAGESVQVEWAE